MTVRPILYVASASPRRRELLAQIGVVPEAFIPKSVDEAPLKGELPAAHAARLAGEKAELGMSDLRIDSGDRPVLMLGADTVVGVGRRILPKAEDAATARACLRLLSGRSHRVYTGLALRALYPKSPESRAAERLVETRVKVARLEEADIEAYVQSEEWRGKAGGYAIQGVFAKHVAAIIGSYSNVVGLPLFETANLLKGAGWR